MQGTRPTRALLIAEGRRHVIAPGGATLGRSRDCDIVLSDANVSRRHAEVLPGAAATWTIADLGSTNGVLVNGHRVAGAASADRPATRSRSAPPRSRSSSNDRDTSGLPAEHAV